jgi:hypothetical protein
MSIQDVSIPPSIVTTTVNAQLTHVIRHPDACLQL